MGAHTRILSLRRREAIELEIDTHLDRVTRLLARLDRLDGDCDLEDDDPAGDTLDERGEASSDDGAGLLPARPLYAVDQVSGPVNVREAGRAHMAIELGLMRSSTGGWRRQPDQSVGVATL